MCSISFIPNDCKVYISSLAKFLAVTMTQNHFDTADAYILLSIGKNADDTFVDAHEPIVALASPSPWCFIWLRINNIFSRRIELNADECGANRRWLLLSSTI